MHEILLLTENSVVAAWRGKVIWSYVAQLSFIFKDDIAPAMGGRSTAAGDTFRCITITGGAGFGALALFTARTFGAAQSGCWGTHWHCPIEGARPISAMLPRMGMIPARRAVHRIDSPHGDWLILYPVPLRGGARA